MSYSDKLKDPRWQKKRLEILSRDNFTCTLCGDKTSALHVHHLKYEGNPWDVENEFLITYCEWCHIGIEYLNIIKKDIISVKKYWADTFIVFAAFDSLKDIYILKIYLQDRSIVPQLRLDEKTLKEYLDFYKES